MTRYYDDGDDDFQIIADDPQPYTFSLPPVRKERVRRKSVIREMQKEAEQARETFNRNRRKAR